MNKITILVIIAIVSVVGISGAITGTGILSQQAHASSCNFFSDKFPTGSCTNFNGGGSEQTHFHNCFIFDCLFF